MGGAFTDPRRVEPLFDVITHKWMHVAHTFDSRPYEEEDAARIFRSIVTAVARLHSVNIVHGNLAPDHILLDMDDDTKVYLPDLRWAGQITVESGVTQPLCFQVSPTPATPFRPYLAHFAPVFSRFCAFSPPRRGGSNEPQAGTQGQETAGVFDSGPQRLWEESPG